MLSKEHERRYLFPILARSRYFLSQDMNIHLSEELAYKCVRGIEFRYQTSVLEITGRYKAIVIMSFSKELLDALVDSFTAGEIIADEEREEIFLSTTQEIINIVVGLALRDIQEKDKEINISTPTSFTNREFTYNQENYISINVDTDYGLFSLGLTDSDLILGGR